MDHTTLKRILHDALDKRDPFVASLIKSETEQQMQKLILVPSVSAAPEAVLQALGSTFQNVCAEGHPAARLSQGQASELQDVARHLAANRRYANRRFYKGVNYIDLIESLAQRRTAALFANDRLKPEHLFVNVQALSGGTANLAVYQALMSPGDTLMGMSLAEGGHLSHGAAVNLSGQLYNIVSYGVNPKTELLDYEAIRQLALRKRPSVIVAGFTSYPWQPEWDTFRAIADEVGAFLVADIAHTAGLVIGGIMPNPVGIADVVTLTTNKTLLGPRSAVVITTDQTLAHAIDSAIFPGAQGAPHPNKFAAVSVAMELAATDEFKALQKQIANNAKALAAALEKQGLRIVYGGTNTHLFVVDLKSLPSPTGFPLYGEPASRILELVGIIVNRNTIPGDKTSSLATGLRMGTPWITQRGLNEADMEKLAGLIYEALSSIHPFTYNGLNGLLPRGKIDFETLDKLQNGIAQLVRQSAYQTAETTQTSPSPNESDGIQVSGQRARQFIQQLTTANIARLKPGSGLGTFLLNRKGELIAPIYIYLVSEEPQNNIYHLAAPVNQLQLVTNWLAAISDGYVLFDDQDIWRKVEGPVLVEQSKLEPYQFQQAQIWLDSVSTAFNQEQNVVTAVQLQTTFPNAVELCQPYFVGQTHFPLPQQPVKKDNWYFEMPDEKPLKKTALHAAHLDLKAKMTPFAGWDMPLRYDSILEEHQAVRKTAGLFDVSHMGMIEVTGKAAATFLDTVFSNYVARLIPGQSCYGYLLDTAGQTLDDAIIYHMENDQYWMVVNAANFTKVWDWLNAVNNQRAIIDAERPWIQIEAAVTLTDLKNDHSPTWQLLALQGPASLTTLMQILDNKEAALTLRLLNRQHITSTTWRGSPLHIARTGYTGEQIGYEIFVTAEKAPDLWKTILETGKAAGVQPAGLAARDSLRIETGLPLWGQELAGPLNITPIEAGFEGFVKYHKPFFVGRRPLLEQEPHRSRTIVRFRVEAEKARRPYNGDPVLDERGRQIGQVTSCSVNTEKQLQGLALINMQKVDPNTKLAVVPLRGRPLTNMLTADNQVIYPVPIIVLERFAKPHQPGRPLKSNKAGNTE